MSHLIKLHIKMRIYLFILIGFLALNSVRITFANWMQMYRPVDGKKSDIYDRVLDILIIAINLVAIEYLLGLYLNCLNQE